MEVNKDKLIEVLNKIEDRLSKIERYLSTTNQDNNTYKDNKSELVPKSSIDFDLIIDSISDTHSKNIVNQIFNNKYPTITQGQYKLITSIAAQNNVVI